MKIAVVVASYHEGTTGDYIVRACSSLSFTTALLSTEMFLASFGTGEFDLYLCIDSGDAIPFSKCTAGGPFERLAMWYIDYRHNKRRETRNPPDEVNVQYLRDHGAWIFQSQREDWEEITANGVTRGGWLSLAADPGVWAPTEATQGGKKRFDVGFAGNLWDPTRARALEAIQNAGLSLGFIGPGKAWKGSAAELLSSSRVGFNISSFFGTSVAFDVNMRFFETLSCGVPLITNRVPALDAMNVLNYPWLCTYDSFDEIIPAIREALETRSFLSSGPAARSWILSGHTYQHRVLEMLRIMQIPQYAHR